LKNLIYLLLLLLTAETVAQPAPHVRVSMIAEVSSIAPGESFDVLLHQDIDPGWHTYWHNPGDSGDPPDVRWQEMPGITIGKFRWPYPERIPYGPLMNFGYHDAVSLPFTVTVDESFADDVLELTGAGRILVCEDICIPERIAVSLKLPVGTTEINAANADEFAEARARIPVPIAIEARAAVSTEGLGLNIALPVSSASRIKGVAYFPFEREVIDNRAQQFFEIAEDGLNLSLKPGINWETETTDLSGVLVITEEAGEEIVSAYAISTDGAVSGTPGLAGSTTLGLLGAMFFALLGGMILNLMPCVFPVLSIKVLSLVEGGAGEPRSMVMHGLIYSLGVVLSFVGIALLLIMLQAAGEAVGWGFQLQSPLVVGLLFYLFLLIALNLLGVFEFGTSLMAMGSAGGHGYTGSFLTGVLATVVAAPCTAPFMGAAIGFALTQSAGVSLLVFASLGLGMALPYLGLTAAPSLLSRLPKPGRWMELLKQALAFPMFASAIWLLWVLGIQTGVTGMMQVMAGGLVIAFSIWLAGQFPRGTGARIIAVTMGLVLGVFALYILIIQKPLEMAPSNPGGTATETTWSPAALSQALAEGPVFVNFTAAWCITCKVNELNALDVEAVQKAFAEKGVTYLKGDWTNEDAAITAALQRHGRSGVPLYLLYADSNSTPMVLPQLLTQGIVLSALEEVDTGR
jgi:thiol:disulfide interchange protein DsbD